MEKKKKILSIDHHEESKTINSQYYCNLLDRLKEKKSESRLGSEEKIVFRQDNALIYRSVLTIANLSELKYEFLELPPYSPDLTTTTPEI